MAGLLPQTPGDLLVFLPGLQEIRHTAHELARLAAQHDLLVLPLYGDLPPEQQDRALLPQPQRRIVLATNVAETSVTVEGITGVVDTGLARQMVYDRARGPGPPAVDARLAGLGRSAGRPRRAHAAGRLHAAVERSEAQRLRPAQTEPEIRRVDLAGAALQLLCWGESDILRFPWLEPPQAEAVSRALALLRRLGAIDDRGVTELGRSLARLPVHPRLGRLLIEAQRSGQPQRARAGGGPVAERDPFARAAGPPRSTATPSDVLDRIEALEEFEQRGRYSGPLGTLNRGPARFVLKARDQLARLVRQEAADSVTAACDADEAVLRSLLAAFPDRLCRRREPRSRRGLMVGGRGVRLAESQRRARGGAVRRRRRGCRRDRDARAASVGRRAGLAAGGSAQRVDRRRVRRDRRARLGPPPPALCRPGAGGVPREAAGR